MRPIHPDLQKALDGGATTLCRCWRIRRQDGLVLGFTDHDRTLVFEGTEFRAASGLDASSLQVTNGLAVDNAQAIGALSDASINEDDLRAGRYDSADVDHWLVDWEHPERRIHLFRGQLGEIRRTETTFEAELRGLTDMLNMPIGRTIQRTCDRIVGDAKCGVKLNDPLFSFETTVAAIEPAGRIALAQSGDFISGWFTDGVLRWLSGRNVGLVTTIRSDRNEAGGRRIALAAEPVLPVDPGDRVLLTAGCDKSLAVCGAKFNNGSNFRGFPHIPGEDWVVAYPKRGETHDGTRLGRG